jgi:chromate transporter
MELNQEKVIQCKDLFFAFFFIGLCGFGGVLPWAHRMLVENKKWLTQKEFTELLSIGQTLPGPNIVNLSVMFGTRLHGVKGAVSSISGLMLAPFIIIIGLAMIYEHYGHVAIVHSAIRGIAVIAPGLIISTALKMAMAQQKQLSIYVIGILAFVGAAILRLHLIWVLLILLPLSVVLVGRRK